MDRALTIYSIAQNLLFAVVLISSRKQGNKALILYFVHSFFTDVFFLLANYFSATNSSLGHTIAIVYEVLVLCRPAIIFYFLYAILEKPMPRFLYGLWALPFINFMVDYVFKSTNIGLYNAGFYQNWYLNVPAYTKVLMALLLIPQVKLFNKEIKEKSSLKKHQQLIKLYWGKYFVYFQLTLLSFTLLYFFITLSNGRLYRVSSFPFVYSPHYNNILYHAFASFFLLVFGYLSLRNRSVFND